LPHSNGGLLTALCQECRGGKCLRRDNAVIKAYKQEIPGIVDAQVAAKKHVTEVDMFTGFTTSSMIASDKVHPNDSGHAFMAERWYSVISPLLPK
jgi:lysophospholipase L1-like esterase